MKENKVPKSNRVDQIKQSQEQQELPARCINSRGPTAQHPSTTGSVQILNTQKIRELSGAASPPVEAALSLAGSALIAKTSTGPSAVGFGGGEACVAR